MFDKIYQNKNLILKSSLDNFVNSSSLIPKFGIELEFYLLNQDLSPLADQKILEKFIGELSQKITSNSLIERIEKEQGVGQVELATLFTADLPRLCDEINDVKELAGEIANDLGFQVSFLGQPFIDDCGSSLQMNISLHDKNDKNLFEEQGQFFLNAIASLLDFTDDMLVLMAPNAEDYTRFDEALNRNLFKKGKYTAPVNLSFGENNRTAAIRIPEIVRHGHGGKRIEYRVAAASADLTLAMSAILVAMLYGIENNLTPEKSGFSKVYGNAFDEQYRLRSFAKNYDDALQNFNRGFIAQSFDQ